MEIQAIIDKVNSKGLGVLNSNEYAAYYRHVCDMYGLDASLQPLERIKFRGGKDTLYATRKASEYLIKKHKLTVRVIDERQYGEAIKVTARIKNPETGQFIDSWGAAVLGKGSELENAILKAHTKAVRRGVLTLCGLGMLDESETENIATEPIKQAAPPPPSANGNGSVNGNGNASKENLKIVKEEPKQNYRDTLNEEGKQLLDAFTELSKDGKYTSDQLNRRWALILEQNKKEGYKLTKEKVNHYYNLDELTLDLIK